MTSRKKRLRKHCRRNTRDLGPIKSALSRSPQPRGCYRKHPYGGQPIPSSKYHFPQVGGNRVAEAPEVVFDLTQGDEVVKTPPASDSLKASLSPPVGGLHSFRRDWQPNKCSKNMLNILTVHHQSKLARVPLIHSGYKAHQRSSSGLLSSLFCQRTQ